MARLIQEKVKQPLAEELLFGKLVHGGEVQVSIKDGENGKKELSFELTPAPPKLVKKKVKVVNPTAKAGRKTGAKPTEPSTDEAE
jgi:ATP-dependent Clp protease ATP-binding subunit ClpA